MGLAGTIGLTGYPSDTGLSGQGQDVIEANLGNISDNATGAAGALVGMPPVQQAPSVSRIEALPGTATRDRREP
jgi:hypothetical protein